MSATDAAFGSTEPGDPQRARQQEPVPEPRGDKNVILISPTGTAVFHHGDFFPKFPKHLHYSMTQGKTGRLHETDHLSVWHFIDPETS